MLSYRSASPGYWTAWLLPVAVILSGLTLESINLISIVTFNTVLLILLHATGLDLTVTLAKIRNVSLLFAITIFCWFVYKGGDPYTVFSRVSLTFAFPHLFYNIVRYYPKSFTFGEALIVTQAFVFTFGHCVASVPTPPANISRASNGYFISLYVEAGFLGVMIASRLLVISVKPWKFLFTEEFFCLWGKCCLAAIGFRLSLDDLWFLLTWLEQFLQERILLFLYCVICTTIALGFVFWKNLAKAHTSTTDRKYFHFLVLAVYLPGILVDREFLYMGSAALMYIFVLVELTRSLKLKLFGSKLGEKIDGSVGIFRDHQDEGKLIITPLYLLSGCSVPIWLMGIHTPTSNFNEFQLAACMAGVLSVGVGDTFASIGGTAFGNTRWRGTNKSFGGTVFCALSQIIFICLLYISGTCSFTPTLVFAVIVTALVNSLVEALTDQIDNLILPLLTFDLILLINIALQLVKVAVT